MILAGKQLKQIAQEKRESMEAFEKQREKYLRELANIDRHAKQQQVLIDINNEYFPTMFMLESGKGIRTEHDYN